MKTKEFIKRVEELGYLVNEGYVDWQISRLNKGQDLLVALVNKNNLSRISTDFGGWWDIPNEEKSKLLDIIIEFAKTSIEDRKEEKKYYLKHKWISDKTVTYLKFDREYNCNILYLYIGKNLWKKEFTKEEIKGFKQTFNTDLSDFEIVEVEDED